MGFFSKEKDETKPLEAYDRPFDIFLDEREIEELEATLKPFGDDIRQSYQTPFLRYCESEGLIRSKILPVTLKDGTVVEEYDFSVCTGKTAKFTKLLQLNTAREKRRDYLKKKSEQENTKPLSL